MTTAIEIRELTHDNVLAVELGDLLALLESEASPLVWRVLDLEAVGDIHEMGWAMLDLESAVKESSGGLAVSWAQLKQLAALVDQIVNIFLVGVLQSDTALLPSTYEQIERKCEMTIQCFDSSFWRVTTKRREVVSRLASRFKETRIFDLSAEVGTKAR